MRTRLTYSELQDLLEDPNENTRVKVAWRVAEQIDATDLTDTERQVALEILRAMAKDAAVMVRQALAESMRASLDLPRDVALDLAKDAEEVAIPLLEDSTIFSDEDLVMLVRSGKTTKQMAIAGRATVGASVSEALVDTGNSAVVSELVNNKGANIPEGLMHRVVDEFGQLDEISSPLAMRGDVPGTICERLVVLVSDEIRDHMIEKGHIDRKKAESLAKDGRERATIDLARHLGQGHEIHKLVVQLRANNRLSPSVIIRAACTGEMRFFEEALACLAGIEYEKAWVLIHDQGTLGFKALFDKTRLPSELYTPCRIAVNVFHELEPEIDSDFDEAFSRKMLQMVLTQYEDLEGEDLEFLMTRLTVQYQGDTSSEPRLAAAEQIAAAG